MQKALIRNFLVLLSILSCFSCGEDPKPEATATPTTGMASGITTNSASIQVTITLVGSIMIDAKGVCWGVSSNPTVTNSKTNEGNGTSSFTSSITGLNSNTTYFVRSYVTSAGKTTYGNEVSFKTLESLSITLTTSPITAITSSSASSGGSMTTTGTGTVVNKGVCWSKSQNPTIADSKTSVGSSTGAYASSITGLESNTTYFVRAYATDNNNVTTYGNQLSFTTLQGFTVSIQTTAVTSITSTTASTGGTITATGTGSITTRGVCWSTTTNPTTASSKTSNGSGTGTFTSSITGLTAGTKYFVRAYSIDNFGNTTYGNELTFTATVVNLQSIDGVWESTSTGNVIKIEGASGVFQTILGGAFVDAKNAGLITLNVTEAFKGLVKQADGTWKYSHLWATSSFTAPPTIKYSDNSTITLSADGMTITARSQDPYVTNVSIGTGTYRRK